MATSEEERDAREFEESSRKIDFSCVVCGVQCAIAPDPPERAVCEEHCGDHQYEYDKWRRGKFCVHCDKEQDYDSYKWDVY